MRFIFVIVVAICAIAKADDSSEMMEVMQANFDACNMEDVDALMETCSVDMPRREEFRDDCVRLWREKDIHYSLISFQILRVEGEMAVASVVQKTHAVDRSSASGRDAFVRNGTGLLTKDECVEYKVAMKKDGRKWKCLLVISEPVPWEN